MVMSHTEIFLVKQRKAVDEKRAVFGKFMECLGEGKAPDGGGDPAGEGLVETLIAHLAPSSPPALRAGRASRADNFEI